MTNEELTDKVLELSEKMKERENIWECHMCGADFYRNIWDKGNHSETITRWDISYVCPKCFLKNELNPTPEFELLVRLRKKSSELSTVWTDLWHVLTDSYDKTPTRIEAEKKWFGKLRAF